MGVRKRSHELVHSLQITLISGNEDWKHHKCSTKKIKKLWNRINNFAKDVWLTFISCRITVKIEDEGKKYQY